MKSGWTNLNFLLTKISGSFSYLKVTKTNLVTCLRFHPRRTQEWISQIYLRKVGAAQGENKVLFWLYRLCVIRSSCLLSPRTQPYPSSHSFIQKHNCFVEFISIHCPKQSIVLSRENFWTILCFSSVGWILYCT